MILPGITGNWASKNAKKVQSLQNKGSIAGVGKIVGGLFGKATTVGNVPPHDHDSPKDTNRITPREESIPPIPPPNPDNITGNLTNNQIIQDKGKALWQGEEMANQFATRQMDEPVPPPGDPTGDQYGNMFSPFSLIGGGRKPKDPNKDKAYVVNKRPNVWQEGTVDRSRDTLWLDDKYKKMAGSYIDQDEYDDLARKAHSEGSYKRVGVQDLEDGGEIKIKI